MEEEICLTCGDVGYETELVTCFKCLEAAIHKYCMLVMPKKNDPVLWLCEECEEIKSLKKSRKRAHVVLDSDGARLRGSVKNLTEDKEISSKKLKKDQAGDEEISRKKKKKYLTGEKEISREKLKTNPTDEKKISTKQLRKNQLRDEELKSEKHEIKKESHPCYSPVTSAVPLIRSSWTGSFNIRNDNESIHTRMYEFSAFLSSKTSHDVCNQAARSRPALELELVPKSRVWPKQYERSGPTDQDIGVYFFPLLMKYEQVFDHLVFEMIRDDTAIRASMENAELLVFTSDELPRRFRRFQEKPYLWGVFRVLDRN